MKPKGFSDKLRSAAERSQRVCLKGNCLVATGRGPKPLLEKTPKSVRVETDILAFQNRHSWPRKPRRNLANLARGYHRPSRRRFAKQNAATASAIRADWSDRRTVRLTAAACQCVRGELEIYLDPDRANLVQTRQTRLAIFGLSGGVCANIRSAPDVPKPAHRSCMLGRGGPCQIDGLMSCQSAVRKEVMSG